MLFFGISVIKSAITPLSQSAPFISFLSTLENPAIAVIFGVLFTDMVNDLERCSDHAINIAYALFHNMPEHHSAQA